MAPFDEDVRSYREYPGVRLLSHVHVCVPGRAIHVDAVAGVQMRGAVVHRMDGDGTGQHVNEFLAFVRDEAAGFLQDCAPGSA